MASAKHRSAARKGANAHAQQAGQRFQTQFAQGQFEAALQTVLAFCQRMPQHADAWADAATTCVMLRRWPAAIQYAERALKYQPQQLVALDALAHAHGALGQYAQAGRYGLQALTLRDARFGQGAPCLAHPMPHRFSASGRRLIAFSLFGAQAKYCEGAILNCLAQPTHYPDWQCVFYIDETVPVQVQQRLVAAGGQVILVDTAMKQWPGPMWRFAAYDLADVACVIFRDCDSVINAREASAVHAWLHSDRAFHMMRDYGSHTELMLAGLWGVRGGALPSMHALVEAFLRQPVTSQHFADQFFLREYVWPYARNHLLQHDSLFGFLAPQPFPNHQHMADFHVGCNEATPFFEAPVAAADGSVITWELYDTRTTPSQKVCSYQAMVRDHKIQAHLPRAYASLLNGGGYEIRLQPQK